MDELVAEFLTETNESLEELDLDLVNLEQNPNDKDLLGKIFRLVHTIKGTCGFLALPRLEKVAHHGENVLGRFRDGDLEVTPEYVTLIFESIDQIKFIVGEIETNGAEPDGNDAELIEKLDAVYEGRDATALNAKAAEGGTPPQESEASTGDTTPAEDKLKEGGYPGGPTGNVSQEELDALEAAFNNTPGPMDAAPAEAAPAPKAAPAPTAPAAKPAANSKATDKKGPSLAAQSLRVNVDVLENLMTMVSELVLTRNQILQIQRTTGESELSTPLQRLNLVVSDLQEGVMKTRMQPIGNAWAKLPRIIRDLSMELNKKIELEMLGQDTELDRQVLELIKDPLTHMVRNSGDHGIEDPETRIAAGKPEMGKIVLNAFHEGGQIIIQISDDGKGLPLEKIKEKILNNGLATAEELEEMNTQQINQFIFKAGFSTAEKVTSVSGRGVGMDVVRTNIEKIGGSVELKSEEGKGSVFTIKIPLTLAIVSALIVESGHERFAIPQLSVRELVMAPRGHKSGIEMIKGAPFYRLRDRLLPLISLAGLLKLEGGNNIAETSDEAEEEGDALEHRNQYIVVAEVGNFAFGIIVDKVFDTEEIVVKPVAKMLSHIDLFSGNTILGDGSVIMILDPNGVAKAAGDLDTAAPVDDIHAQDAIGDSAQKTSLLLFRAGDDTPKAVPLSLVSRLEIVPLANVEKSSGQMMVQYRDQLMPLIPFNTQVDTTNHDEKPVLVFADKNQSMGLIVDEIIDIKEEHIDVQINSSQQGIMGSAIINGAASDVVDIGYFLSSIDADWFNDHGSDPYDKDIAEGRVGSNGAGAAHASNGAKAYKKNILLVDDSPFFRNMLTPLLSAAGYEVRSVEGPNQALKLCDEGYSFDLIVSDIEMPDIDGFEFAAKVQETRWENTPMIALSSHATQQDIERGMAVGFRKYVAKFDREMLLSALSEALNEHYIQKSQQDALEQGTQEGTTH